MGEASVSKSGENGVVAGAGRSSVDVYCDGDVEPTNPGGHGAAAFLFKFFGKTIHSESVYLGKEPTNSNNMAEYVAVIRALEYLRRETCDVRIFSDSKLLAEQMQGNWRAKAGAYFYYYHDAKSLVEYFVSQNRTVGFTWIPREENAEADKLCLDELAKHGIHPSKRKR